MEKIQISVIIPVYNGEKFIRNSYNTVLGQGIEDIEIIYIDNNSQDKSIDEIKKLQAIDPRVQKYLQPIQGAAAARNLGIKQSKGEFIYMLDVDDQIYSGALRKMKQVLDTYPNLQAVFGKMVKSDAAIVSTQKPDKETDELIIKPKPYWGLRWFSDLKTVVGPPAFLYRKKVFDEIGLYENALLTGQDTALDIKLGMLCDIAFIDRYIYLYLKHGTSTTDLVKRKIDRVFMQWPRYTKSHLPFYLDHNVPNEYKRLLFKKLFGSMGRMLQLTKDIKKRRSLKRRLIKDIEPIETPWALKLYLDILVHFNSSKLYKVYVYYLIPHLLPQIINKNEKYIKT